jgi:hypothetical protein
MTQQQQQHEHHLVPGLKCRVCDWAYLPAARKHPDGTDAFGYPREQGGNTWVPPEDPRYPQHLRG